MDWSGCKGENLLAARNDEWDDQQSRGKVVRKPFQPLKSRPRSATCYSVFWRIRHRSA